MHRLVFGTALHLARLEFRHHGFDDDDRVIDDGSDSEHQTEERDDIKRETGYLHDRERTEQRHDDRDRRDERRLPVLQEEIHDDDDEDDGDDKGLYYVVDGGEEEVITGLQRHELQSGGQGRLELFVELVYLFVHLSRIRARRLIDKVEHTRFAVHVGRHRVGFRADLHRRYIPQVQHVAVVLRTDDDVLKLLDGLERTFVLHRVLVGVLRLLTERTGGGDETLGTDGRRDIVRLESVLRHHVRLHPYAQGVGVT